MRRTLIRIHRSSENHPAYLTIEDSNGETLAHTEGYSTNHNAERAAKALKKRIFFSKVVAA